MILGTHADAIADFADRYANLGRSRSHYPKVSVQPLVAMQRKDSSKRWHAQLSCEVIARFGAAS